WWRPGTSAATACSPSTPWGARGRPSSSPKPSTETPPWSPPSSCGSGTAASSTCWNSGSRGRAPRGLDTPPPHFAFTLPGANPMSDYSEHAAPQEPQPPASGGGAKVFLWILIGLLVLMLLGAGC